VEESRFTPYADIDALLQILLAGAQGTLGDRFLALYVHGSLATGDFEPGRSDIDFLVVTEGELPGELLPALAAMHAGITASGMAWADRLEGSYIPRQALRRYDPAHARHPALRVDGSFGVDGHGSDWIIQRSLIRAHATVLAGPPPCSLIDPVQPEDLRQAVVSILCEWWSPPFANPERFQSSEYQAYAILTMCRALYTLHNGSAVSKTVAAGWAQAELGDPWALLINQALQWRHGDRLDKLSETFDFIDCVLARAGLPPPG
jgi:hypothetical protein